MKERCSHKLCNEIFFSKLWIGLWNLNSGRSRGGVAMEHMGNFQKVCSYISRVWLWESDGMQTIIITFQGGNKGGDAWLYGVDTLGKEKTKTNCSWSYAQSHWAPHPIFISTIKVLFILHSQALSEGSSHSWHATNMCWLNEPRRLIVIGRKCCLYGLHLSKRYIYRHGFFFLETINSAMYTIWFLLHNAQIKTMETYIQKSMYIWMCTHTHIYPK